jgi:phosphatidylglycerophosphate synthase
MDGNPAPRAVADVTAALAAFLAAGTWLSATAFPDAGQPVFPAAALAAGGAVIGRTAASVIRREPRVCTPADRVTLIRAVLVACCATLAAAGLLAGGYSDGAPSGGLLVVLGTAAFLLDAVDGRVARYTGTASAAGSRLDTDTDGALVLVLSCAAAGVMGPWTLGTGLLYYSFLAAGWFRPSLREPLPPNAARRIIGAFQPAALLFALMPGVQPVQGTTAAALALALLVFSFGRDVVELERLRRRNLAVAKYPA